jgi:hypothetical protein
VVLCYIDLIDLIDRIAFRESLGGPIYCYSCISCISCILCISCNALILSILRVGVLRGLAMLTLPRCGGVGVKRTVPPTPYVRHSTDCTCCDFGHLRFYFVVVVLVLVLHVVRIDVSQIKAF